MPKLYIIAGCNGAGKTRVDMSEVDMIIQRELLSSALKESFWKMLDLKKKLGQDVVTTNDDGEPIVISAQEAEELANHRFSNND